MSSSYPLDRSSLIGHRPNTPAPPAGTDVAANPMNRRARRVLITGMSGTGKSTVLRELAQRGYRVVDADLPQWSVERPLADGSGIEQVWREDAMSALLAEDAPTGLFLAGCASNQGLFYDRFDAVVLLSVPREILLQRLAT